VLRSRPCTGGPCALETEKPVFACPDCGSDARRSLRFADFAGRTALPDRWGAPWPFPTAPGATARACSPGARHVAVALPAGSDGAFMAFFRRHRSRCSTCRPFVERMVTMLVLLIAASPQPKRHGVDDRAVAARWRQPPLGAAASREVEIQESRAPEIASRRSTAGARVSPDTRHLCAIDVNHCPAASQRPRES